jgi:tRNA(Ile)-lysidine synthase
MFTAGDTVVVAVSGGPDSVALAHALRDLQEELGLSLHIAHLNHGIRGTEADEDADFVRRLADELDLPVTIEKADVPAVRKLLKLSVEEAARKVRYEFLDSVADDLGAARIVTAHTADDQAETVLMNLIRGAGPDGLAGIPFVRGRYVRPLLSVTRDEVMLYSEENHLQSRTDSTNLSDEYRRNRVRLELIPLLEVGYNPGVKDTLAATAEIMRAESEYMAERAAEAFAAVAEQSTDEGIGEKGKDCRKTPCGPPSEGGRIPLLTKKEGLVSDAPQPLRRRSGEVESAGVIMPSLQQPHETHFHTEALLALPLAMRRRVIRMAVESAKGDLKDVAFKQVERILHRLESGKDFGLTLPSGVVFAKRDGDILRIHRSEPELVSPSVELELPIPGGVEFPELKVAIAAEILSSVVDYIRPPGSLDVVIDMAKVVGTLVARNWLPGDRIRPLGMMEDKKLQDIFTDAKVPRRQRDLVPVIVDDEKIIWVVGLAISDLVKVTKETRHALRLACYTIGG